MRIVTAEEAVAGTRSGQQVFVHGGAASPSVLLEAVVERAIGEHVGDLIPDGATLQMGIGSIPAAVGLALRDKKELGV